MKQGSYDGKYGPQIDLRGIEMRVLQEGQEWMRRRMEDLLQEKVKSFSPGSESLAQNPAAPRADD